MSRLDSEYGFGGLKFGQEPTADMWLVTGNPLASASFLRCAGCKAQGSAQQALRRCQSGEAAACQLLVQGASKLGGVPVFVYYKFDANQLASVEIDPIRNADNLALLAVLREWYGPGVRRRADELIPDDLDETWDGEQVQMRYTENRVTGAAMVSLEPR